MSRKTSGLSELETRRQLLVIESELNRSQLGAEWHDVTRGVHHWAAQVRAVGSMASSAAQIGTSVGGLFRGLFHRVKPPAASAPSVITTVFKGARAGLSIWNSVKEHFK